MSKEKLKTIDIKGKAYVTVNERVRYFNEAFPFGKITTDIIEHPDGVILMKTTVTPDVEKPERFFTGLAYEKEGNSFINKTSYIENCESSSVGRALGFMGIGIETSIASAEEVRNAIHQQENASPAACSDTLKPPQPIKEKATTPEKTIENQTTIPHNAPKLPVKPPEPSKAENTTTTTLNAKFKALKAKLGEEDFNYLLRTSGLKSLKDIKTTLQAETIIKILEGVAKSSEEGR